MWLALCKPSHFFFLIANDKNPIFPVVRVTCVLGAEIGDVPVTAIQSILFG